jgi:DNA repair protein SbcC/Rad50
MRLKEFSILRYGPLPDAGRVPLGNFNLFWGSNEDGKTLTIDALVKLLLGRNAKDFDRSIDRVEEKPEGYTIIEDDEGKEIKLPEKGDLTRVADLTSSQCRNIFVIRNSDLSIAGEGEFYTSVTQRLTGLRTEELSEIKEALREIGKLTPGGAFRDTKDDRLKTRLERSAKLIERIEVLGARIQEEGFPDLEEASVQLSEGLDSIEEEIRNLEDASKREEYERGKKALQELASALEKIRALEIYEEPDKDLWKERERDIERYRADKERRLIELRNMEGQLLQSNERLQHAESETQVFEVRKDKLDDQVKPELKNYEMDVGKVKGEEVKSRFYLPAGIGSAILLAVSIVVLMLRPSAIFYALLAFFLTSTIVFVAIRFSLMQKKAHLAAVFERIRINVSAFELGAESVEEIYSNIQRFEEAYQGKSREFQAISTDQAKLVAKIAELRDKIIPDLESKIREAEWGVQEMKAKSREQSLDGYIEKLELKRSFQRIIGEQESVLESRFGKKSANLEENISYWGEELKALEQYKDKAIEVEYSRSASSGLSDEREECKEKLRKVNEKIESVGKEMAEVAREANDILKSEEPLYCETSVDLKIIKDKLQSFMQYSESNRENALKAIEIFEEIEKEEKSKVSQLFGANSPIARYFSHITNGLYEDVEFNQETNSILVKRRDGVMLTADQLSGGAYDQLYLSIRLALGEKLLKGRKGFFILDDPFIKADPQRLRRQIEMLEKISELEWQILYFSAKGEVKDALRQDIEAGIINYVEVQPIYGRQD